MIKIKEYVKAESLEQAYELNQKRANRVIGGMLWMRMSSAQVQTAIDLSGLGLNTIEETEAEFSIGCMTTLRQLELHEGLNSYSNGAIRTCVKDIVGVQFRNLATIGGSIFGRFGFSDVLTCFLAMDSYVELYKGGILPLTEFVKRKKDKDILVRVIVRKTEGNFAYLSHRNTKTDFPVLAVGIGAMKEELVVSVGARPMEAMRVPIKSEQKALLESDTCTEKDVKLIAGELAARVPTGGNMRASAEYRSHLADVLIKRGLEKIREGKGVREYAD